MKKSVLPFSLNCGMIFFSAVYCLDLRCCLLAHHDFLQCRAQAVPPAVDLNLDTVNERLRNLSNQSDRQNRPKIPSEASTIDPPTPLEGDALLQFHRDEEKQYRAKLIEDGCPPCHPQERTFPYDTEERIPKEHPAAMYYLKGGRNGHGTMPLVDQLRDWNEFRGLQKRIREDCQKYNNHDPGRILKKYARRGQYRLRRRNYAESASLVDWSLDLSTQSHLQNWLEFEVRQIDYNSAIRIGAKQRIGGAFDEEDRLWHQNFENRRIELHEGLLVWIEQQRVALSAAGEEKDAQSTTTTTLRAQRQRSSGPRAVDAAIASALAERRRSRRIQALTKAATAGAGAQQEASPAAKSTTTTLSKTRGRTRVSKEPIPHTHSRPTQHRGRQHRTAAVPELPKRREAQEPQKPSTMPTAKAQKEQRRRRGAWRTASAAQQDNAAGRTPARPPQNHHSKQRVTKTKVVTQHQQVVPTLPVYTRSGRQIKKPTWLGSV